MDEMGATTTDREVPDKVVPNAAGPAAEPAAGRSPTRRRDRLVHGVNLAIVLAVALLAFLPGLARLPVTDRDEALFVQASRQMIESGDFVDIRFQDVPRYKKPAGIYWLQGLAVELSGQGADAPIVFYRLPSLLGAILSVLLIYGIGAVFGGPVTGLVAGLMAALTLELGLEARIAKTDAMLLCTVMAAQYALAQVFTDPGRRRIFWRNALFWTAIGLGTLIKGPITPLVAGLTIATLCLIERSAALWRALSPLRGLAWALVIVLPWLVAIGWISGGAFFTQSVGHDMLAKVATGQESHGAPPGMHLLVAIATFWPLSAFAPLALAWAWGHRDRPLVRFAFAWAVPGWVLFELVATKLPNYVLPFMPALALLAAAAVADAGLRSGNRWYRLAYAYVAFGAVALGLGLNGAFVFVEGYAHALGLGLGLAVGISGILAWRLLAAGRLGFGLAATALAAAGLYGLAYGVLLPAADRLWLSERIAEAVAETRSCPAPRTVIVGYREPSVVFRLGTATEVVDAAAGAAAFRAADCAVAAVNVDQSGAFLAALSSEAPVPARLVEGRNLNGLKTRSMQIFVKP